MKIELGSITPQQITQLAGAQLGSAQTLSETSTAVTVRIPLLGLAGYKAIDTTVQFTPGSTSISLNSMSMALVTSANASLPYFTFSETGISAATEAAAYSIGNTVAAAIRKMMIGETADASFVSQYMSGDDNIVANATSSYLSAGAGNDRISGGGGADVIDGGSGIDTAQYRGPRAGYVVTRAATGGTGWTVTDTVGTDGTDTLTGVERLSFGNTSLALDLDGHAGTVVKVIGALFGPQYVQNKDFVGIGLHLVDSGMSYADVVQLALSTSAFQQLAGGSSNADFVRLVYANVVGHAPSTAEVDGLVSLINNGSATAVSLAMMASEMDLNAVRPGRMVDRFLWAHG